jgi:hypothetical protein
LEVLVCIFFTYVPIFVPIFVHDYLETPRLTQEKAEFGTSLQKFGRLVPWTVQLPKSEFSRADL